MSPAPSPSPPPRHARRAPWVVLGGLAGVAATVSVAVFAWAVSDGGQGPSAVLLVGLLVAPIALGLIVGLGTGHLVRAVRLLQAGASPIEPRRGGGGLAVVAATSTILVNIVVPLLPAPFTLAVAALALDDRRWVRVVAASVVFAAAGVTAALPAAAASAGGGRAAGLVVGALAGAGTTVAAVRRAPTAPVHRPFTRRG